MKNVYGEKSNFQVQWEKVKQGTLQEKIEWFIRYFGLYTLVAIGIIVIAVLWIISATRAKTPEVLSGVLLDAAIPEHQDEVLKHDLCERLGLDPDKYALGLSNASFEGLDVSSQYYQAEALIARVAAGEIDILGSLKNLEAFTDPNDPESGMLSPLSEYLSAEQISSLDEAGRVIRLKNEAGQEIPFFIDIAGSPMSETLWLTAKHYEIGLSWTAPHKEHFSALVDLILGK